MSFTGNVVIVADGGCENNGSPNATAYGSYAIEAKRGGETISEKRSGRIDYPQHKTNNAAEVQIFIDALNVLLAKANGERITYPVRYITDSALAVNWITGCWKVKAAHMKPLVNTARSIAERFDNLDMVQTGREYIVKILGH